MAVQFNEKGHATIAGDVRAFYYDAITKEYHGWSDEFIPVGVSLPGNSTLIAPGESVAGQVWIFDGSQWLASEDHRGETVYSIADRSAARVNHIGPIHDGYKVLAPGTAYDIWNGTQWITDTVAQHESDVSAAEQDKKTLRLVADGEIDWLTDAVGEGDATTEEITSLAAWKAYRVKLMRIKTDTEPDIEWPDLP